MAEFLTDTFCEAVAGPTDARRAYVIYYDTEAKGFGLRVTRKGAKSFVLNYRAGGVERRYTIGSFNDPWRTKAARREALRLKKKIDVGEDPQGDKEAIRSAPKITDLIELWRTQHAPGKRERSRREDEKLISQWIRPELGTRKLADLRIGDVRAFHRKVTDHGTPVRANRALALLSTMMSLAVENELREDNPCRGVRRNPEDPRERHLDEDELGRLTEALAVHPDQAAANAIRLLLMTGARKSEVLRATWAQIDLGKGIWTKPSSHTKQKKTHVVPLPQAVIELLQGVRRTSPLVFPGIRGDLFPDWRAICASAGIEGVRLHDLRHTYASAIINTGASLAQVGALLGHAVPSTTARYAHHYQDPLRALTEGASITLLKPRARRC
jgi:integrase